MFCACANEPTPLRFAFHMHADPPHPAWPNPALLKAEVEDKKAVVGGLMNKRLDRDLDHNGAAKYAHGQNTTRRAQIDVSVR